MIVSGLGSGRRSLIISLVIKPTPYFQLTESSGFTSTEQYKSKFLGQLVAKPVSSSYMRMSSTVLFPNMRDNLVPSSFLSAAWMTWQTGLMPVPPATHPIRFFVLISFPIQNSPQPRQVSLPLGPSKCTTAPFSRDSMCWDMIPPSGKRGCTSFR